MLQLRQGFGRLIRSHADCGVVAILDPRLRTRGYGRAFLAALPHCPLAEDAGRSRHSSAGTSPYPLEYRPVPPKKKPRTPTPPRRVQAPKARQSAPQGRQTMAPSDLGMRQRAILYGFAGLGVVGLIVVVAVFALGGGGSAPTTARSPG